MALTTAPDIVRVDSRDRLPAGLALASAATGLVLVGIWLFDIWRPGIEVPPHISFRAFTIGIVLLAGGLIAFAMQRDAAARRNAAALAATQARIRADLERVNAALGERVAERTEDLARAIHELREANEELEAFSYSVSHDLRAPLRAMTGFAQALREDYAAVLPPEATSYLGRIEAASGRMSQLIDDLLGLARVTRYEMRREVVDVAALALQIDVELRELYPDRRVHFACSASLPANGDRHLLVVALRNLLGNAWRFTSRNDVAHIEFGVRPTEAGLAYFVRDDGAGFDMRFANKLFVPFQRLHSSTDFEGTGIGLATVQRIIRRHRGEVWGEGEPGHGATFYFTLGSA